MKSIVPLGHSDRRQTQSTPTTLLNYAGPVVHVFQETFRPGDRRPCGVREFRAFPVDDHPRAALLPHNVGSANHRNHELEVVMGGELAFDSCLVGTLFTSRNRKGVRIQLFRSCAYIPYPSPLDTLSLCSSSLHSPG